jgi:2-polyprenyl-6-methoxyphenol hydroxylase-like FAD-dependent oxidoreductase
MEDLNRKALLIVGAGPVGLTAALFLNKHTNIKIIEKQTQQGPFSKAFGVSPRTLELLETTGATETFLKNGRKLLAINIYRNSKFLIKNELSRVDHKYPFMLVQSQAESEEIMTDILSRQGVSVNRGVELCSVDLGSESVVTGVMDANGTTGSITSDYFLAADGASSMEKTTFTFFRWKYHG